jgi:hypothetical protein
MSNSNAHTPRIDPLGALRKGARQLARPVRFVGFWLSVALPLVYLPLLVGGLSTTEAGTFVALFALNLVALVAGHNYAR